MKKRMLIDAQHREETRVALINNDRIEDFDCETVGNNRLRGNVYLAKVTRVEPSLQACFVEYDDGRSGFLAFREIHPDYYNLPQEDRDALKAAAALVAKARADEDEDEDDVDVLSGDDDPDLDVGHDENDENNQDSTVAIDDETGPDTSGEMPDQGADAGNDGDVTSDPALASGQRLRGGTTLRHYKIQEVIRHRQVLLVQVVREERGNKGAGLTTYLSLAGRYLVLMPNTPRGGGVSRKIVNAGDRKRLKGIVEQLNIPECMGLIVRTAGERRSRSEILRDYGYLENLWNCIRSKTMESVAPALIHEEGGVVHRAMRDMFERDVEEVIVHGDEAYREAKDLSRMMMPAQSGRVKRWTAPVPLFVQEGIEEQIDGILSPTAQLKSGGYLVIDQTEALVAIDVNSGKATRERNIEQTALRTNLEAAEEACRQIRLRDLAGLVVIDFIDMDENRNNRAVEKKMQACLKLDRARVQNTRISQFGLMEISRQRRRVGVMQANSKKCSACDGAGQCRSVESSALQILRDIESAIFNKHPHRIKVTVQGDIALYLLNSARSYLTALESENACTIAITSSTDIMPGNYQLKTERKTDARPHTTAFRREDFIEGDADDDAFVNAVNDADPENEDLEPADINTEPVRDESTGRKRRRGRRGARRNRQSGAGLLPGDGTAVLDALATSYTNLLGEEPLALPESVAGDSQSGPSALVVALPGVVPDLKRNGNGKTGNDNADRGKRVRRRRLFKRNSDKDDGVTPDDVGVIEREPVSESEMADHPEPVKPVM